MDEPYVITITRAYGHNSNSAGERIEFEILTDATAVFYELLKTDEHIIKMRLMWGDSIIHDYREYW